MQRRTKRSWIAAGGATVAAASLLFAFSGGAQATPDQKSNKTSAAGEKSSDSAQQKSRSQTAPESKGAEQKSAGGVSFDCSSATTCDSNHAQFPGGRLAIDVDELPQGSEARVMVFVDGKFATETTKEDTEAPVSVYADAPAGDVTVKAESLRNGAGTLRGGARWG